MSLVTIVGPIAYTWIYDRLHGTGGVDLAHRRRALRFRLPIVRVLGRQETVPATVEADAA